MTRVCVWMNIPSHYQSSFYEALVESGEIDLNVCYFNGASADRAAEGWNSDFALRPYEVSCAGASTPDEMLQAVPDWRERTHVVSSYFSAELVERFCAEDVAWCHWSETPGVRLADLLGYHMGLYRLLNPIMLKMKRAEGARIRNHALGAFAQGRLARNSFQRMGVPENMIEDLFYAPAALPPARGCDEVKRFANGRKVFVCVGALCERKGVDVMLKAFAALNTPDWCVVFCGLDRQDGANQKLTAELGLNDQTLFLGAWPSDRIAEVYAASDVLALPSRFDGWGAVLNEAASLGLPLIGTDLCGASWHGIQPDQNGYRAKADSVASLSAAMKNYVDHPDRLNAHGAVSKRIFAEELTPAVNADRFVAALKKWGVDER